MSILRSQQVSKRVRSRPKVVNKGRKEKVGKVGEGCETSGIGLDRSSQHYKANKRGGGVYSRLKSIYFFVVRTR